MSNEGESYVFRVHPHMEVFFFFFFLKKARKGDMLYGFTNIYP